jgi:protein ImuA
MWIKSRPAESEAPLSAQERADIKAKLRREINRLEHNGRALEKTAVSTGCPTLDAVLPWQGLPQGGLHIVQGKPGDGAVFGFSGVLAGRLRAKNGVIVWIQRKVDGQETGTPYGPGLDPLGVNTQRLLIVKTRRDVDLLWSMEEALRCSDLAVVVGEGVAPNLTAVRRLQLAAETGGTTALLIMPPGGATLNVAALTYWRVMAAPAPATILPTLHPAWDVELVRCRGGKPGQWRMEWQHEAFHFDLAPPLAHGPVAATG